ncbi:MAG: DUF2087 domain-containing protein [Ktedonobacterales bacterium]
MTTQEQDELQTALRYLKALADQTCLRMLGLLTNQKCSVEELAALLDLKASTVSWHLARLKEILKQYHPDFATLRRDLIGFQHLQREYGVYWRLQLPDERMLRQLAG